MTAAKDFKDEPLDFMKENVVLVRYGYSDEWKKTLKDFFGSSLIGGVVTLTLAPLTGGNTVAYDKRGTKLPVYALRNGANKPTNEQIHAYWCPYSANQTLGVMLGDAADFMFTAEMSGCTLGLGSSNKDGSRMVYHSNLMSSGTTQSQDQMTELAKVGVSSTALKPANYRNQELGPGVLQITPFGVRTMGKWNLYYQIHSYQTAARIDLMGIKPVTGVSAF